MSDEKAVESLEARTARSRRSRFLVLPFAVCLTLVLAVSARAADRQIVRLKLSCPEQVQVLDDLHLDFVSEGMALERDAVVTDC